MEIKKCAVCWGCETLTIEYTNYIYFCTVDLLIYREMQILSFTIEKKGFVTLVAHAVATLVRAHILSYYKCMTLVPL